MSNIIKSGAAPTKNGSNTTSDVEPIITPLDDYELEASVSGSGLTPTSTAEPKYDYAMASEFLTVLAGGDLSAKFQFRTFDDKKSKRPELTRAYHGTLSNKLNYLKQLNNNDAGVFVTVNITDGKGRSTANIIAPRAVYLDFDGPGAVEQANWAIAKLPASIVVESSPNKRHVYWLLNKGEDLERLRPILLALAAKTGADKGATDIARVLRIPGFIHRKGEPVMTKLLHTEKIRYSLDDIVAVFDLDVTAPETRSEPSTDSLGSILKPLQIEDLKSALLAIVLIKSEYLKWVGIAGALFRYDEVGFKLFHEWSMTQIGYKDEADCRKTFYSIKIPKSDIGAIFKLAADDYGWVNPALGRTNAKSDVEVVDDDFVPIPDVITTAPELKLSGGLKLISDYIYNGMARKNRGAADFVALAVITAIFQPNFVISSRDGLKLNDWFLVLAPTAFGKEWLLKAFNNVLRLVTDEGGVTAGSIPAFPSSTQGLHQELERNNGAVVIAADEVGSFFSTPKSDTGHRAMMTYAMRTYSSGMTKGVNVGTAVSGDYKPIDGPTSSIIGFATRDDVLGSFSEEQASRGLLNRFSILLPSKSDKKHSAGAVSAISEELRKWCIWATGASVGHLPSSNNGKIEFDVSRYVDFFDVELAEIEESEYNIIAGRLGEKIIKTAGLLTISDKRFIIEDADFEASKQFHMNMFLHVKNTFINEVSLSGNATTNAYDQVLEYLKRKGKEYSSQLDSRSRAYRGLSIPERNSVINSLIANNEVVREGRCLALTK